MIVLLIRHNTVNSIEQPAVSNPCLTDPLTSLCCFRSISFSRNMPSTQFTFLQRYQIELYLFCPGYRVNCRFQIRTRSVLFPIGCAGLIAGVGIRNLKVFPDIGFRFCRRSRFLFPNAPDICSVSESLNEVRIPVSGNDLPMLFEYIIRIEAYRLQ